MTREEKELLLKDLCVRLPYKLHCRVFRLNGDIKENDDILYGVIGDNVVTLKSDKDECLMYYQIKPYLRPMSSMTKNEKQKIRNFFRKCIDDLHGKSSEEQFFLGFCQDAESLDYLNIHHLDYRGLIPKGLALEAPEGMYEIVPTSI